MPRVLKPFRNIGGTGAHKCHRCGGLSAWHAIAWHNRIHDLARRDQYALRSGHAGREQIPSKAHLGEKQRSPFRNNFSFSRRHSLHAGPVYFAIRTTLFHQN